MLSKEEKRILELFQFYDKYRLDPLKKIKIDVTIDPQAFVKLKDVKNRSAFINDLILSN